MRRLLHARRRNALGRSKKWLWTRLALPALPYAEGRRWHQLQAFSLGPWSMTSGRQSGAAGSTCMLSNCGRFPAHPTSAVSYARTPTERCLTWAGRKWPRCSRATGASGCGCPSITTVSARTTCTPSASRMWSTDRPATATRTRGHLASCRAELQVSEPSAACKCTGRLLRASAR